MTASIVTLGGERCRILPQAPFGLLIEPARNAQPVQSLAIEALRELARRHGVLILRGFESGFTDPARLTRYGEEWGEIMMWPFGAVLDVKEHENATDHIFDSSYVPLHWDGMYKPTLPEFQLFHCVHAPAADEGGRTTFINTRQLLSELDGERLARWERVHITYRIKQVVHYGGQVRSPLLVPHPVSGETVLRYNEPPREGVRFLNQHALEIEGWHRPSRPPSCRICTSGSTIRATSMPTSGKGETW